MSCVTYHDAQQVYGIGDYHRVIDTEILNVMSQHSMDLEVWGFGNSKRQEWEKPFWDAWNEIFILAAEAVGE